MDRKKRLLNRVLLVSGASAVLLFAGYVLYLKRMPRHYVVPAGQEGWVTVRFEKAGAPALPEQDGAYLIQVPAGGLLETSTRLEDGWARDAFFEAGPGGKTEFPKGQTVDGESRTRIHDLKLKVMRYDSIVARLPDGVDTTLWDGARISKSGSNVEVRSGRPTLLHFYLTAAPRPYFFPHDSLPLARQYW
jgi:hypothetical protein